MRRLRSEPQLGIGRRRVTLPLIRTNSRSLDFSLRLTGVAVFVAINFRGMSLLDVFGWIPEAEITPLSSQNCLRHPEKTRRIPEIHASRWHIVSTMSGQISVQLGRRLTNRMPATPRSKPKNPRVWQSGVGPGSRHSAVRKAAHG